jgi:hypothetical protein
MEAFQRGAPEPEDAAFTDDVEHGKLAAQRDEADRRFCAIRQAALNVLMQALRAGKLEARYRHPKDKVEMWVEASEWEGALGAPELPGLTHNYLPHDFFLDRRKLPAVEWEDGDGRLYPALRLHFDKAEFDAWLGDLDLPPTEEPPTHEPTYRTGLPGRPTSRHIITLEAVRRLDAGEAPSSLGQFSSDLSKWLKRVHPEAAPAEAGTIENRLRVLWRTSRRSGSPTE